MFVKMPGKNLSPNEKTFAVAWLTSGESCDSIAQKLQRSKRSIERIKGKMVDLPFMAIPKRKQGSGHPRSLALPRLLRLKRIVQKNPAISARKIRQNNPHLFGHVSVRNIQHRLRNDCNLPSRRPAKEPLLTQAMKDKRFDFARAYQHWKVEDWSKVMFTDESTFRFVFLLIDCI